MAAWDGAVVCPRCSQPCTCTRTRSHVVWFTLGRARKVDDTMVGGKMGWINTLRSTRLFDAQEWRQFGLNLAVSGGETLYRCTGSSARRVVGGVTWDRVSIGLESVAVTAGVGAMRDGWLACWPGPAEKKRRPKGRTRQVFSLV